MGVEFRFIWPRGDDHELDDPREVFGESFLQAHEIQAADLIGRPIVKFRLGTPAEARQRLFDTDPLAAFEVFEFFRIMAFAGEDASVAAARFRAGIDEIGWSAKARQLVEFFRRWNGAGNLSAVHIRCGDIVTGGWRHFMAYEKYVPIPFVEAAIRTLSGDGTKPVLVMSDNQSCIEYLRSRHRQVRVPRDIYPGYDSLSDVQKALADILMLSQCQVTVGPKRSAFSHLGANLGGAALVGADRFVPEGDESGALSHWIEEGHQATPGARWLRPFLARDICWYLDVFGETLPRARRLALACRATELEPDFVGALARRGRMAALSGRHREARTAARLAKRCAASVERHADPLVEGLATGIGAGCLALLETSRRRKRRSRLGKLHRLLERCRKLTPQQMDMGGIIANLSYQVAALEWADRARDRRTFEPPAKPPRGERVSGLIAYRSHERFDPVLRDLEQISLRISRAIIGTRKKKKRKGVRH